MQILRSWPDFLTTGRRDCVAKLPGHNALTSHGWANHGAARRGINGRYRVAKLNVDENPRTAAQFQIQSIPTMLIFRNGKLVDRLVGAQPKPAIVARLLSHAA